MNKDQKDFDWWNTQKKKLDVTEHNFEFYKRELWWCSVGINIGREQHSLNSNFSRPVIIVRKFTHEIFWGVPLTTKLKGSGFRVALSFGFIDNECLILQMRAYDKRRLIRKIGTISERDFIGIREYIREILR